MSLWSSTRKKRTTLHFESRTYLHSAMAFILSVGVSLNLGPSTSSPITLLILLGWGLSKIWKPLESANQYRERFLAGRVSSHSSSPRQVSWVQSDCGCESQPRQVPVPLAGSSGLVNRFTRLLAVLGFLSGQTEK